jgi:3-oxoacyl-[acyl-carrier protein] reductase
MDLGLTGKRALVTGSSSGLGFASARALANEGAIVTIASRNESKLGRAARSIEDSIHAKVHAITADVSEPDAVHALVEKSRELMGGIDILIANAGGPPPGSFASTPFDAYSEALRLNLLSTVALCQLVVPSMREQKWGRVLAITSASVREPIDRLILSNTARAGVTGFLKTLAREVAADGVTVNSLQPGLHLTDRLTELYGDTSSLASSIPARFLGDPDDFGRVAAFLCSVHTRFITGVALPLDGGSLHGLQ